jgi:xanthine dehydrogenase accessory factor
MLDILETVDNWLNQDKKVAIATVVDTWGSAPRRTGAKMAVTSETAMIGSVSGGCVETAVIGEALDSLADGQPRLLQFGVSDDTAWEVGLACGGKITVYVEPLDLRWWQAITDGIRQDRTMVTINALDADNAGQKILVDVETGIVYASDNLEQSRYAALLEAAQEAARKPSGRARIADLDVLVDVYHPRPRLIIIGGAHTALALHSYAVLLGYQVILIDPRQAFATHERFPQAEIISHQYPDKVLNEIGLNSQTYIAILTHDPKIDDPALRVALPSPAPYIGVLSSKRTHEQRIERLTENGLDPQQLVRIRTPIGLDIGAQTPEEIALCIMAEIVAVRNGAIV